MSLLVILHVAVFDLRIIAAPDVLQVQYTPDDAYYYLTLSRNFARLGLWTFDSGASTATGFHLLLAYVLSILYKVLRPTAAGYVRCGLALSAVTSLTTALIAWALGLRRRKPYFLIFLALLVSSTSYTYNTVSATEWSLVILWASLYCICLYRGQDRASRRGYAVLFLLGLVGSLSRSDFGLLPLWLFVASLVVGRVGDHRPIVWHSLAGLAGAVLGLLLTVAHNAAFTGHFLQSSVKMKAYWAQIHGVSYTRAMGLILQMLGIPPPASRAGMAAFTLSGALLLLLSICVGARMRAATTPSGLGSTGGQQLYEPIVLIAASLCLASYVLCYARSASVQPWYTANLVVPAFAILAFLGEYAGRTMPPTCRHPVGLGGSIIVMGIIACNLVPALHLTSARSPWPYQQTMLDAGKYLANHTLDGRIGSWNAGIIGYYQGGTVINLDGLVNDDVYEHAVRNTLPSYLRQQGITYLIDFERMLGDEKLRLRGGYDDVALLKSLRPVRAFDDGPYGWAHMTLYALAP